MKRLKHGKTNTRLYNTWQRMKQRLFRDGLSVEDAFLNS